MPKNVVVGFPDEDFLVTTLDEETDEDEEASSAIEAAPAYKCDGDGLIERPKSHNFVYPSASINTFSGFKLSMCTQERC